MAILRLPVPWSKVFLNSLFKNPSFFFLKKNPNSASLLSKCGLGGILNVGLMREGRNLLHARDVQLLGHKPFYLGVNLDEAPPLE